jgi:primary-amine oxidase
LKETSKDGGDRDQSVAELPGGLRLSVATRAAPSRGEGQEAGHPLDPLTCKEYEIAVAALRADPRFDVRMLFVRVELHEPPKAAVLAFPDGGPIERQAFVVILDPGEGATYEAVVSIDEGTVRSWVHIPGIQPPVTADEFHRCEELVRADPRFAEVLRRRGVLDVGLVAVEAWTMGGFERPEERGRRLVWTLCWARRFPEDNQYGHPI